MTKKDQRRIIRELCASLKKSLLAKSARFPTNWDGHEIRALFAREATGYTSYLCQPSYSKPSSISPLSAKIEKSRSRQFHSDCYANNL